MEGKRNRNDEELWFSSGARTAAAHGYVRRVRGRCAAQLLELKSNLAFLLAVEVSRGGDWLVSRQYVAVLSVLLLLLSTHYFSERNPRRKIGHAHSCAALWRRACKQALLSKPTFLGLFDK